MKTNNNSQAFPSLLQSAEDERRIARQQEETNMETKQERQQFTGWCLMHWKMVRIGGAWAVPRSGLIFEKTAKGWNLNNVMPYSIEMEIEAAGGADLPKSASELKAYQLDDFACIQRHNEAAGLEVTDTQALLIAKHITTTDLQRTLDKQALATGKIKSIDNDRK
jgi:hypothetical protein